VITTESRTNSTVFLITFGQFLNYDKWVSYLFLLAEEISWNKL